MKSVISNDEISANSPEVTKVSQLIRDEIPSSIKELFRACQSVAEVRMSEKKLYTTVGDVDKEARSMAESYNLYIERLDSISHTHMSRSIVLSSESVGNLVNLMADNGTYISKLPALLKVSFYSFYYS